MNPQFYEKTLSSNMKNNDFISEMVVFKPSQGINEFEIILDGEHDTVWVTEQQLSELFGKARRTIGEHIRNIYKEGELEKESTWRNFRQVQTEGDRTVKRTISAYNLDVVISVGYRVKSTVGIEFRRWATQRLKDYLVKGYAINSKLLTNQGQKIIQLENQLDILREKTFDSQRVLTEGFLNIISKYSKSFELLNRYDSEDLQLDNLSKEIIYVINYDDVKKAIHQLKRELIHKSEAGDLFETRKTIHSKGYWEVSPKRSLGNWHILPLKSRQHNCYIQLSKVTPSVMVTKESVLFYLCGFWSRIVIIWMKGE